MKISVIIPVYNEEKHISKCLEFILNQTYKDLEIICVDDGSTDKTPIILKDYAEKNKLIRVITLPNGGPGLARNAGIDVATGDYLAILDADDEYKPTMLETMLNIIVKEHSDVCICRAEHLNDKSGRKFPMDFSLKKQLIPSYSPFKPEEIADNIFTFCVGWAWDKLFSHELIKRYNLRFSPLSNSEDAYFVYMAIALSDKISYTTKVLTAHRIGVETSVSNRREQDWHCFYYAIKAIYQSLIEHGKFTIFEKGFVNFVLDFSLWYTTSLRMPYKNEALVFFKNTIVPEFKLESYPDTFFNIEHQRNWLRAIIELPLNEKTDLQDTIDNYICSRSEATNKGHKSFFYKMLRKMKMFVKKIIQR